MIRRVVIPGGSYGEAFPSGDYRVLTGVNVDAPDFPYTNPFGEPVLFLRFDGDAAFAGQGHRSGRVIRYSAGEWIAEGTTCGVNPVAFGPQGLVVNDHCQYGTQGIRWIDPDGTIHTGDHTYDGRGSTGVAEWTQLGDVLVGQSYVSGCTIRRAGDIPRQLEPGHCTFVRFNREGSQLAVAMWKQLENCAVLYWLDEADIITLPAEPVEQPEPEPPPDPNPEPQPEPAMRLPDHIFATLKSVRAKYPTDRPLTAEEIGAVLNETAWVHRGEGAGLQRKDSGTNSPQPRTGILVWRGFRIGDKGFDVCGACTVGRFDPVQADSGPADMASFVPPVQPLDTPPEPTDPPDGELEARVRDLETVTTSTRTRVTITESDVAMMKHDVSDLRQVQMDMATALLQRIEALEKAPPGSVPFDPTKWKTRTPVRFLGTFTGTIEKK